MLRIGGQNVPTRIILLIASDAFFIVLGLVLVTAARFHDRSAIHNYLGSHLALPRFALVVVVCIISLYYHDFYNHPVRRQEPFVRLGQALAVKISVLAFV